MTEVDFPRGGQAADPSEKAAKVDDPLFGKKRKKSDKGKAGPKKQLPMGMPEGHETDGKENSFAGVWRSSITQEVMSEGVLGLGFVTEICATWIALETADSFRVQLPVTELGPHCIAALKNDTLEVEEAFPIGHAVPFKVLAKPKVVKKRPLNKMPPKENSHIQVTCDPAKVNKHIGPTTLLSGLAIAAEVKSVEEKGLLLDVGLQNVSAFLSTALLPNGFQAKIGLPLTVRVQSAANTRMVQVALAVEMDTLSEEAVASLHLRNLMPGTVVHATPLLTRKEGAYVDLGNGVTGWIHRRSLPPRLRLDIDAFARPLRAVVLMCDQSTRLLCLSAHPDIVAVSRPEKRREYSGIHVGDLVSCTVERHFMGRVEFSIYVKGARDDEDEEEEEEGTRQASMLSAYASHAMLEGDVEKQYKEGTRHEMRVISLKMAERRAVVTNKKDVLKRPMVSFLDAKPGAKVSATIKKLIKGGIQVTVFDNIRGFIPVRFLSDGPIKNIDKQFIVGETVACRVLGASNENHSVLLTARKSQVDDKGELIVDVAATREGQTCVGVVVKSLEATGGGVLIQFYNNIAGRLPQFECRKRKVISEGDAVSVRVVKVDQSTGRINLALADDHLNTVTHVVVKSKKTGLISAKPLRATIDKFEDGGKKGSSRLVVTVEYGQPASLVCSHLSDCLDSPFTSTTPTALAEVLAPVQPAKKKATAAEKAEIDVLPLGDLAGLHRVTAKRFLLQWTQRFGTPTAFEELTERQLVAGVVTQRVSEVGYFVEVVGGAGLTGCVPLGTVDEGDKGVLALSLGQTVIGRVMNVDQDKKRFTLSLGLAATLSDDPSFVSRALVRSAVQEQAWLASLHGLPQLGERLVATVVQLLDGVLLLKLPSGMAAYARAGNFPEGEEAVKKSGAKVRGIVVDYAWPRGDVEMVVEGGEESKEKGKGKKKTKKGREAKVPRVVVSKRDYTLVVEEGTLIAVPARLHPNQVLTTTEELPKMGDELSLTAEEEEEREGTVQLRSRTDEEERRREAVEREEEGRNRRRTMARKGRKAEEKKKEAEPVTDDRGEIVKRFGIYKGRVEGTVDATRPDASEAAERALLCLHIKLGTNGYGRLHVSQLPHRFLVSGTKPLEAFLAAYQYKHVSTLVIATKKFMLKDRERTIYDVTLDEAKLDNVVKNKKTVEYKTKFHIGDVVPIFFVRMGAKQQMVFEVNPRFRAIVDRLPEKTEALPERGEMRMGKVLAVNKQSMELKVAIAENLSVEPGSTCMGRVENTAHNPLRVRVILANGDLAWLTLSGVCDDFEKAAGKMAEVARIGQLINVRALSKRGQSWCITLDSRATGKYRGVNPLKQSCDDVSPGNQLRGFVTNVKGGRKVELGPGLYAEIVREQNEETNGAVNDLVSVTVVNVDNGVVYVEVESVVKKYEGAEQKRLERKRLSDSLNAGDEKIASKRIAKAKDAPLPVEIEDPGFDWDAAQEMDALAEISGIVGKSKGTEDVKRERTSSTGKEEPATKKKRKSEMTPSERAVVRERELAAKERRIVDEELTTAEDYARAVKGDPNSAELWIRYMSHFMQKDDLASARATAEKALKMINYREDAELYALWCAYVNLEVSFGDDDSSAAVFKRACDAADSYKVHKHMAATLVANEKFKEADEVFEKLLRKFRAKSDEVWTLFGEYLMNHGRAEEARQLMARALECVPKQRHVQLISRFAQMEYAAGDVEKGRNLFENVLATYPKKTDVWNVFVDLTAKHDDIDQARRVVERACSLPLSIHKLRPFYRKWIEIETKHGDERSVEEVKKRAEAYLTELKEDLKLDV